MHVALRAVSVRGTCSSEPVGRKGQCGFIRMVFFFQAEDGIRDYKVTGVQTCALPIFREPLLNAVTACCRSLAAPMSVFGSSASVYACGAAPALDATYPSACSLCRASAQIGRASCRERV